MNASTIDQGYWVLDSGSSRHLVNDPDLLENVEDYDSECVTANGDALRITKKGSVVLMATALGKPTLVRLQNVQYAENLERNIISYGLLEARDSALRTAANTAWSLILAVDHLSSMSRQQTIYLLF